MKGRGGDPGAFYFSDSLILFPVLLPKRFGLFFCGAARFSSGSSFFLPLRLGSHFYESLWGIGVERQDFVDGDGLL